MQNLKTGNLQNALLKVISGMLAISLFRSFCYSNYSDHSDHSDHYDQNLVHDPATFFNLGDIHFRNLTILFLIGILHILCKFFH